MLRDIQRGDDPQVAAVVALLTETAPDILLLTDVDHDVSLLALDALRDTLRDKGLDYPFAYAPTQNAGRDSGHDLDGDGRLHEPEDAHGFGMFTGEGSMALLSRYPVIRDETRDFSAFLWKDLPGSLIDGAELTPDVQAVQRLSSTAHWVVPVDVSGHRLNVMAFHATPPVFDGPEDRNGRRNHDEIMFWQHYLDGAFGPVSASPFVILGDANLDPDDSNGRNIAIRTLLDDPRIQDPRPSSSQGAAEQTPRHKGNPALDTANWDDPEPGNLRVDYVLPSADLTVSDSAVIWPARESLAAQASRHGLVWVDLLWPPDP